MRAKGPAVNPVVIKVSFHDMQASKYANQDVETNLKHGVEWIIMRPLKDVNVY